MKLFYLREIFLCRGVRDGKLKDTLDSASRLAMGGKKTETNNINGHCGQRKGLRNQLGHTELQEYNTGPNKGSIRNCWREEYRIKDSQKAESIKAGDTQLQIF